MSEALGSYPTGKLLDSQQTCGSLSGKGGSLMPKHVKKPAAKKPMASAKPVKKSK